MITTFCRSHTFAFGPNCLRKMPMVPGPHTSWVIRISTFTQILSPADARGRPAWRARIFSVIVMPTGSSFQPENRNAVPEPMILTEESVKDQGGVIDNPRDVRLSSEHECEPIRRARRRSPRDQNSRHHPVVSSSESRLLSPHLSSAAYLRAALSDDGAGCRVHASDDRNGAAEGGMGIRLRRRARGLFDRLRGTHHQRAAAPGRALQHHVAGAPAIRASTRSRRGDLPAGPHHSPRARSCRSRTSSRSSGGAAQGGGKLFAA